jgi:hypothetical protein
VFKYGDLLSVGLPLKRYQCNDPEHDKDKYKVMEEYPVRIQDSRMTARMYGGKDPWQVSTKLSLHSSVKVIKSQSFKDDVKIIQEQKFR